MGNRKKAPTTNEKEKPLERRVRDRDSLADALVKTDMSFSNYIKKHRKITLGFLAIPAVGVFVFAIYGGHIKSDDWLSFFGALLTYFGTTVLSAVALYQSQRANELSEKVYELNERAFMNVFVISLVTEMCISDCAYEDSSERNRILTDRLQFCDVDYPCESCQGYEITVKNCGHYPITQITVSTTYEIGRKRIEETLERSKSCFIAPNESAHFLLCNTPKFETGLFGLIFEVRSKNTFGEEMAQKLEIVDRGENGQLHYTCTVI